MTTGSGFVLRAKLAKLAAHHGVEPTPAVHIPLAPPSAEDVIVEGYASTPDLDLTKMIFRRGALCWEGDPRDIPLLISHDRDRVAGEILDLRQKPDGLWIKARITDPEARRLGAFSIGGVVSAHTLHNETRPDFYGEVSAASLTEISMVSAPANPKAIVTRRYPIPPDTLAFEALRKAMHQRFDLQIKAVNLVARAVEILARGATVTCDRPAPDLTKCGPAAPMIYGVIPPRPPTRARRETSFSSLVRQLEHPL